MLVLLGQARGAKFRREILGTYILVPSATRLKAKRDLLFKGNDVIVKEIPRWLPCSERTLSQHQ